MRTAAGRHQLTQCAPRGGIEYATIASVCGAQVSLANVSWTDFKVLSVWSTATASDYGHVVLETAEAARLRAESPGPCPSPGPGAGACPIR